MDPFDFIGVAGIALVTVGVWLVSPPAALIVLGCVLVGVAVVGARRGQASQPTPAKDGGE